MSRPTAEDDDDLLELPGGAGPDDDRVGVADADELLLHELADEPEEVGLDADPLGALDEPTGLHEESDEQSTDLVDDSPLEVDAEIDVDGEEHGWTEDNEGSADGWADDQLVDEAPDEVAEDDAGEEGVDDPLLDGLSDEEGGELVGDDLDAEESDAWADELPLEMGAGA